MSKLPNAPLVEIVAEIKWNVENKDDLNRIQYLHGDLFNELKTKYPHRESIIPSDIPLELVLNKPAHRFKSSNRHGYPLIQAGAGIVTLNTIDEIYHWNSFFEELQELSEKFINVFPYEEKEKLIYPGILFIDFFPFDFEKENAIDYVNKYFHVSLGQNFYKTKTNPRDLSFKFSYNVELGDLIVTFQKGQNTEKKEGIVMQTRINGIALIAGIKEISNWFEQAHDFCSDLFKKLTEGELYESFKQ